MCIVLGHDYYLYLAGQCIVKSRFHRSTCTADIMQYARTRYLQLTRTSGETHCGNTRLTEGRSLKHAVSEALLALAEDKRPEANQLLD
jgi:hypothetical protein